MVLNAVSVFNYARHSNGKMGSIWAQTRPGGCDYDQYWSEIRYLGYWQMPLDYLQKIEPLSFPRIGNTRDRPVGDQMRPLYFAWSIYVLKPIIFKFYSNTENMVGREGTNEKQISKTYIAEQISKTYIAKHISKTQSETVHSQDFLFFIHTCILLLIYRLFVSTGVQYFFLLFVGAFVLSLHFFVVGREKERGGRGHEKLYW